jgi:hypothetical protein
MGPRPPPHASNRLRNESRAELPDLIIVFLYHFVLLHVLIMPGKLGRETVGEIFQNVKPTLKSAVFSFYHII